MSGAGAKRRMPVAGARSYRRARNGAGWDERCTALFEDLRKPARVMVARAYGRALSAEEIEDVYANAWASTLAALRGRESTMGDEELRSYLLTAVAGHAGKEMRRRSRKPAGPLEDVHAQVLSDAHQPLPEERVTGAETASIARDLLASLPARRRAVMLLRYGWGLSPAEICGMVSGLSPRAYRKEITRGVEQLIERLGALESGHWCETREPILRDYVAGVADDDTRRQAVQHIAHCRPCAELVRRLSGRLHDLGSGLVLGTAALGGLDSAPSVLERVGALAGRGRDAAAETAERAEAVGELAAGLALSGSGRGAGAAGAGIAAKLAGLGAAGKATLAVIGVGAAAGAFIAAGVVPGLELGSDDPRPAGRASSPAAPAAPPGRTIATGVAAAAPVAGKDAGRESAGPETEPGRREPGSKDGGDRDDSGDTDSSGSEAPTAGEQEFGLPAPTTTDPTAAAAPAPAPATATSSESGAPASSDEAAREFGP